MDRETEKAVEMLSYNNIKFLSVLSDLQSKSVYMTMFSLSLSYQLISTLSLPLQLTLMFQFPTCSLDTHTHTHTHMHTLSSRYVKFVF